MRKTLLLLILLILSGLFVVSASYAMDDGKTSASEAEVIMKMLMKKDIINEDEYQAAIGELRGKKGLMDSVSLTAGITAVVQGTTGNEDNDPPGEDVNDGTISGDIEISFPLMEDGEAFVLIESGAGNGLQGDEIVSFWGVNDDAGDNDSRLEVTEVWYEHRLFDDMVIVTIGKIDLTNYFDTNEVANDETTQFLASGFVNNIAIDLFDNNPGIRLTVSPVDLVDISIGAQSDSFEDILEKFFLIAEADIKPKIAGLQGNYRVYAWTNRTNHSELKNPSNDREHGWGIGVSLDQQVMDYLTLFARLGYQDKKIYEFDFAWSGGLALNGGLWDREDDVIGIAYGSALLSKDNKSVLRSSGITPGNEGHFEAYYSLKVNEHITISPDFQVIINAGGDDDFNTVVAGAVRAQLTF